MNVPFNGSNEHPALFFCGAAGLGSHMRFEDSGNLFQHFTGHDQFGQEIVSFFKLLAHSFHGPGAGFENIDGIRTGLHQGFGDIQGLLLIHIDHGFNQLFGHSGYSPGSVLVMKKHRGFILNGVMPSGRVCRRHSGICLGLVVYSKPHASTGIDLEIELYLDNSCLSI